MNAVTEFRTPADTRAHYAGRIDELWQQSREGIGKELLHAKDALPYGEFLAMIEKDLPFSARTAQRLMSDAQYQIELSNTTHGSHLPPSYRTREELRKLPPEKLPELIEAGKIKPDMTRREAAEVVHGVMGKPAHAPLKLVTTPAPTPPRGAGKGAVTFSEFIWLMIEARKARGISQVELDARIGWTDSMTSKYEIPHMEDGRRASWDAIADWLTGIGHEIVLQPVAEFRRDVSEDGLRAQLRRV